MTQPADLPRLPPRSPDSHKGDFGRALLIGGSTGMCGAVALAGMSCLRSGAGLVQLATPDCCLATVAAFEPSYMTAPLAADGDGRIAWAARARIGELAAKVTVVACGPGLGQSSGLVDLLCWLYEHVTKPLVIDADGLNALAARREVLSRPGGSRVLTPHPAEFGRLTGLAVEQVQSDRLRHAQEFARRTGVVVVLKGHRTCVTDGDRGATNDTGNPGMATGGTGDVLTGIITALIAQGLSSYDAARLGVYVHGLAGDLAAADLGQISLIASDLIDYLPAAFQTLQ